MSPLDRLGNVHPTTRAIAAEVLAATHAAGYPVTVVWGMGGGEHATGRALDFMVSHAGSLIIDPKGAGDFIADYLWTHRERLGLIHEIWRQRIRSTDPRYSPGQWIWMADRGSTTENHMDHVHSLHNGTYTPPPAEPAPEPAKELAPMYVISCPARGIALAGPGHFAPCTDNTDVGIAIELSQRRVLETTDTAVWDRWRRLLVGIDPYGISDVDLERMADAVAGVSAAEVAERLKVVPA